jgi:anti-sigma B factor antagonist
VDGLVPDSPPQDKLPTLTTNHRQFGAITIGDLRGSIDLGKASLTLRHIIRDLVESGRTKIILNFLQVNSMDSAGVGELAGVYMPVKSKGGGLKFLNPTKKVYGILQITRLDKVLEVYTDEQTAFVAFPERYAGFMNPGSRRLRASCHPVVIALWIF